MLATAVVDVVVAAAVVDVLGGTIEVVEEACVEVEVAAVDVAAVVVGGIITDDEDDDDVVDGELDGPLVAT